MQITTVQIILRSDFKSEEEKPSQSILKQPGINNKHRSIGTLSGCYAI